MISAQSFYAQPQEQNFNSSENKLAIKNEPIDLKADSIFIRRNRIERPTDLQIRYERLRRVIRSHSAGII